MTVRATRNGGHHRFRAGIAEGHALVAGHLGEQRGDLAGELRLRAGGKPFVQLLADRFDDEIRRVAERGGAVAVDQVDVLVAVDVPDPASPERGGTRSGIDELLPFRAKARRGARIGEHRAIVAVSRLDPAVFAVNRRRQFVDMALSGSGVSAGRRASGAGR